VNPVWDRRLQRATLLTNSWPQAGESLRFFRAVTSFQKDLQHRLQPRLRPDAAPLDPVFLGGFFMPLLSLVERAAPADLARLVPRCREASEADWQGMIRSVWSGPPRERPDVSLDFFPTVILQPLMMLLADRWREEVGLAAETDGTCPFCGRPPVAAVLDGADHRLVCSLCATEWIYPRVRCPRCHESLPERRPELGLEGLGWVRLAACGSCTYYLKVVDLTRMPDAVAIVDEAAALGFDQLARERGYSKLCANVIGG
jgi:formate dehydrogenase accessory protein FdhE